MTGRTITLQRRVPAPPAEVYAAWTVAERLASWWWPQLPDTTYELDPVVGGDYRIRSEAAGIGVHGSYLVLDPPGRIELSWVWEDGDDHGPQERVVVELEPTEEGTLVTVTHEVADAAGADDFAQGWSDCLDRLVRT